MHPPRQHTLLGMATVVSAPLLLAMLEMFHAHPHDLLELDVHTWMLVHYAQIPLFALSALAVTTLVQGQPGISATVARIAMFVFAISFVAFDTVAGVAVGILVHAAQASATPETWRSAIEALWTHPIMGGMRLNHEPSLAVLGRMSLAIGGTAAAAALIQAGRSWAPSGLLAISSFGINLFHSHSWPGGPLTFGGIAVAAGWLQWEAANAIGLHRPAATPLRKPLDLPGQPMDAHLRRRSEPPSDPTTGGD